MPGDVPNRDLLKFCYSRYRTEESPGDMRDTLKMIPGRRAELEVSNFKPMPVPHSGREPFASLQA